MDVPHNLEHRSVLANTETKFKLLQSVSADINGLLSTFKATNDALKGNTVVIGDILERTSDLKSDLMLVYLLYFFFINIWLTD
jgi:hypothetical protein